MTAVFKHELSMYYHSMRAYIFGAFVLLFAGIGALIYNINASVANFEYVLNFISMLFVVLVPLLTMRIMAEEQKQKTEQLLFSLPISTTDIILGKFFSLAVVFAVPLLVICTYPLVFRQFGDVFLPTSYGTILAFYFLGMALMSIGLFISCLTESQGLAAGLSVVAMLFCYYCDTLADYVSDSEASSIVAMAILIVLLCVILRLLTKSDFIAIITGVALTVAMVIFCIVDPDSVTSLLPTVMQKISLYSRFDTFVYGVFDVTALVYDLTVMAFFLFLSVQVLETRRYNG